MKIAQRTFWLIALGVLAVVWTFLMGIGVKSAASPSGAGPGFSAGNTTVAGKGATIKYLDGSHFPAVTVYLTANDPNGLPVLGLHKENFTLSEDGQPVALTGFTAAGSQAATVILVIDSSGSMADNNKIAGAQQAAISFVKRLQPGQDRAGLIVFNNDIRLSVPLGVVSTANQQTLIDQINAINPTSGTEFYQAVQRAVDQLQPEAGRKVVLALTDGLDNHRQDFLAATIAKAKQANVPVYTIGLGGRNELDEQGLQALATQSGGVYYASPSADELEKLYLAIASNLRNEYALTYQSATPNLDGTRRSLQVAFTTASGQTIQGEAGYGVSGVLASSPNLALFIPLFGGLLIGLGGLYTLPVWRRRTQPAASQFGASGFGEQLATASVQPLNQPPWTVPAASPLPVTVVAAPTLSDLAPASRPVRSPNVNTVGQETPALVLQLRLPAAENLIGRDASCQVVLANPSVVAQHARIAQVGERYVVDDLSGGQTQVSFSGDPVQLRVIQRNALRDGALLQIGQERFSFRQPAGQPPYLERRYPLTSGGLTLGSEASCDVLLEGIAPRQAHVGQDGPRWVVDDLAGGAFVSYSGNPEQERPLAGRNALKAGSTVRIGPTILRLEV